MDPSSFYNVAELSQPDTNAALCVAMDEETPFGATQASLGWWLTPTLYSTLAKGPLRTQIENKWLHPSAKQLETYFGKMEELGHKKEEWPKDLNDWVLVTGKEEESWLAYILQTAQGLWRALGY
ncbi:hypothetical protein CEP52_017451 [Fusarium oligoseptatum]|uniref:Uncharacterized protein n=1 Tax=Fusarium oligoseptatum TaxID=2604345 RepID=A0A428RR67_9HYPO|nr:hypothetical protein CEP52_017451 [Fusarium oligoseptatum]